LKKTLNICLITQEYPPHTNFGGIAVYYNQLAKQLIEIGHNVTVLTRHTKGSERIEKNTKLLKIFRIGLPSWTKYLFGRTIDKLIFSEAVSRHIYNLEKRYKFDVIETTETYFEGLRIINNKEYINRIIVQSHGSNNINVIPKGPFSFLHKLDFKLCYLLEQKLLRNSKVLIVPSESGKTILKNSGICKDKIQVIYHGINTDQFKPLNKKSSSNILNVLFVGKLHKMKGIDFIWKVMSEIGPKSSIHFNFVGDIHPSEYSQVKFYLEKYSEFSSYLGHVKHTDINEVYNMNDVLLLPSRFEQFGLVYAEAMSSGLIVFAGRNGGGSEIINNNKTGFIIDPENDVDFVSNKLKEICSNLSNYKNLKINSRKHILKHFSNSTFLKKKLKSYYDIYGTNPH
jgi:L-malate glycosyltransferase